MLCQTNVGLSKFRQGHSVKNDVLTHQGVVDNPAMPDLINAMRLEPGLLPCNVGSNKLFVALGQINNAFG
jgi:hypothetical protein